MCGIAGAHKGTATIVNKMLDKITHRGGDGRGLKVKDESVHGHVRLALLDQSEGSAQPFESGGNLLSFNGEIWNYKDLKKEMPGVEFNTSGDTEVLASWLSIHGIKKLDRLSGMFCFAWTDNEKTIVCRDAFGEIPVYIAKRNNGYYWASERKAFDKKFSIPLALPPGHYFDTSRGNFVRWYNYPKMVDSLDKPTLKGCLTRGVRTRMNADDPVAALISGGLDSSIILTLAHQVNPDIVAYTGVYDKRSPDLLNSRAICRELEIDLVEVEVSVTESDVVKALRTIEISSKAQIEIAVLCMPLAKRIKSDGFKAVLSGEAADELFGGYGNFCIQASNASTQKIIELRKDQVRKMSRGNFVRCNKVFMGHGIECRLPFMDKELVERSVQCGKTVSPVGKKILKEAFGGMVNKKIIGRVKDTFQGGSGVSDKLAKKYPSPIRFYNSQLKAKFSYLPKD